MLEFHIWQHGHFNLFTYTGNDPSKILQVKDNYMKIDVWGI